MSGGFFDQTVDPAAVGVFAERLVSLEPNAAAARFLLDLAALTGDPSHARAALAAIRAVGTERQIARHWRNVADLLMAVERARLPWARIELRGSGHPLADGARRLAAHPLVVGTRTPGDRSLAVVCADGYCSAPVTTERALRARVADVLLGQHGER